MDYLTINNITKKFGKQTVLKDVSFSIKKGEFVCILGPSGCGKTTILRIIAGIEKQDGGNIILNNNDISFLHPSKRNFGIVFQSYALFPNMTAAQSEAALVVAAAAFVVLEAVAPSFDAFPQPTNTEV